MIKAFQHTHQKYFFLNLFCCICFISSQAIASPVNIHRSKDFKSLIIQSERPEIVICISATNQFIKNSKEYEQIQWLDTTSITAILNEKEENNHLVRVISLNADVLQKSTSFFRYWVHAKVICEQVDEAYPRLKIIEYTSNKK